ncbi:T9SS type A sorting domain-containing protein [Paenimyroides aestuarii]|uniref:T9SS type A sorting domain-containing protein n=1 Tax=Paenimyroides aestuarii TaxID=2968490 RepID=A0ABY5NUL8_9FLAO|nr:T9SS type A sorting domain-containing protein [Paenimyroides aestuarii]UUV22283.1 T9SS type A sorting domain-containing protein [Paenimyroides aestuarii]
MKKILLIITTLLGVYNLTAQVLYNETFDSYNWGNVGTDPTGVIPGQGGWLTEGEFAQHNSVFTIVNEANRGKVLDLTTPYSMSKEHYFLIKPNLNVLIDNRTAGNDVIKIEIDYFTGNKIPAVQALSNIRLLLKDMSLYVPQEEFIIIQFSKVYGFFGARTDATSSNTQSFAHYPVFPFNTWVTLIMYLDYTNNKIYMHIPQFNKVSSSGLVTNPTSTNLMQDYKLQRLVFQVSVASNGNNNVYSNQRYDNIKITAMSVVPPEVIALSSTEQLAAKFNLYPNPANNVVNITNAENMQVQQITVYDVAGKQLSTQNYNNETEIQLNVANLASGTYMLHLQTKQGTAVKKLVKK